MPGRRRNKHRAARGNFNNGADASNLNHTSVNNSTVAPTVHPNSKGSQHKKGNNRHKPYAPNRPSPLHTSAVASPPRSPSNAPSQRFPARKPNRQLNTCLDGRPALSPKSPKPSPSSAIPLDNPDHTTHAFRHTIFTAPSGVAKRRISLSISLCRPKNSLSQQRFKRLLLQAVESAKAGIDGLDLQATFSSCRSGSDDGISDEDGDEEMGAQDENAAGVDWGCVASAPAAMTGGWESPPLAPNAGDSAWGELLISGALDAERDGGVGSGWTPTASPKNTDRGCVDTVNENGVVICRMQWETVRTNYIGSRRASKVPPIDPSGWGDDNLGASCGGVLGSRGWGCENFAAGNTSWSYGPGDTNGDLMTYDEATNIL